MENAKVDELLQYAFSFHRYYSAGIVLVQPKRSIEFYHGRSTLLFYIRESQFTSHTKQVWVEKYKGLKPRIYLLEQVESTADIDAAFTWLALAGGS